MPIFMSLHRPAGACISVASSSPIHVPPIQHVLKQCDMHIHTYYININKYNTYYIYLYLYKHVIKTILGHLSWQAKPTSSPASWDVKIIAYCVLMHINLMTLLSNISTTYKSY